MIDLIIENGMIVDGTGAMPFMGSVAVKDGRIVKLDASSEYHALHRINAIGKYVTPGFIDVHRHADLKVFNDDFGKIELQQGITTVIAGNCGLSAAPCTCEHREQLYDFMEPIAGKGFHRNAFATFNAYTQVMEGMPLSLNFGSFVGNGTVRIAVKGFDKHVFSLQDMQKAKSYIEEALDAGAMGLSMGLAYSPEDRYSFEELTELVRVLKRYSAPMVTHIRGEGSSLVASIGEVIRIAEIAEVPLHISHFKAAGQSMWGKGLEAAIEKIENARQKGLDITCDVYPYEAGSTTLVNILPPYYKEGGINEMIERLKQPGVRKELEKELSSEHIGWDNLLCSTGWDRVVISSVTQENNLKYVGMNIKEISELEGKSPVECVTDLIIEERGKVGKIFFHMCMEDVKRVIQWKHSIIASDSLYCEGGLPHPRIYGSFTRVLARFVRDERLLTIQEAIYKMTGFPAKRFGLKGRGAIKEGSIADIVIFDMNELADNADYTHPDKFSYGFSHIFLSGNQAVENGQYYSKKTGKFIKRER